MVQIKNYNKAVSSFNLDLREMLDTVIEKKDNFVKGVVSKLFTSIVKETPIDTGVCSGSWVVGIDKLPNYFKSKPKKSAKRFAIAKGKAFIGKIPSNVKKVYISNYVDYSVFLEYGHSDQAPFGMVRRNLVKVSSTYYV